MMRAITVKYLGPTNTKGTRLSVTDYDGNRATYPRNHSLRAEADAAIAAEAFRDKMGWAGKLAGGWQKPGVYVFVFI